MFFFFFFSYYHYHYKHITSNYYSTKKKKTDVNKRSKTYTETLINLYICFSWEISISFDKLVHFLLNCFVFPFLLAIELSMLNLFEIICLKARMLGLMACFLQYQRQIFPTIITVYSLWEPSLQYISLLSHLVMKSSCSFLAYLRYLSSLLSRIVWKWSRYRGNDRVSVLFLQSEQSLWYVDHIVKTMWKWSSWRFQDQDTNISFISDIHGCFLSLLIQSYYILMFLLPLAVLLHSRCL